jgi:hypothetical protein
MEMEAEMEGEVEVEAPEQQLSPVPWEHFL